MPETVFRTIGPGRDFETLADFASALPPSLVTLDQIWIAQMDDAADDPGGAVFDAICDGDHYIEVRAAPGLSFADKMDPLADPLIPTSGSGALVRTVFGDCIRVQGTATDVRLRGLQILAENGEAVVDNGTSGVSQIARCVIEANGTGPAVSMRGASSGEVRDTCILQRGSGDGLTIGSTISALTTTVMKPERLVAEGVGIRPADGTAPSAVGCVAFGFRQAFGAGIQAADSLSSDQTNELAAPANFADPYWTAVSATVDSQNTIPGPFNVPLQRLGNNTNAFARFDGQPFSSLASGQKVSFTAIIAQPTSLISAILLDSTAGRPEVRVTWTTTPPTVGLFGTTAGLQLSHGEVVDLGGDTWRVVLEAVNTTVSAITVLPTFYVTRGVENTGLNVGMYAGALMAGQGNLGNGFVFPDAVPGTNTLVGVDPATAIRDLSDLTPDLRAVVSGPLDGAAPLLSTEDVYGRPRLSPDTRGGATLNPGAMLSPARSRSGLRLDSVRLLDQEDVLTAHQRRTIMPGGPQRTVGV